LKRARALAKGNSLIRKSESDSWMIRIFEFWNWKITSLHIISVGLVNVYRYFHQKLVDNNRRIAALFDFRYTQLIPWLAHARTHAHTHTRTHTRRWSLLRHRDRNATGVLVSTNVLIPRPVRLNIICPNTDNRSARPWTDAQRGPRCVALFALAASFLRTVLPAASEGQPASQPSTGGHSRQVLTTTWPWGQFIIYSAKTRSVDMWRINEQTTCIWDFSLVNRVCAVSANVCRRSPIAL